MGTGAGRFNRPRGPALDAAGRVYVAEEVNDRVQQFTGAGAFLRFIGSPGFGVGKLSVPFAVAVDGDGNVDVAEEGNDRVQRFAPARAARPAPTPEAQAGRGTADRRGNDEEAAAAD